MDDVPTTVDVRRLTLADLARRSAPFDTHRIVAAADRSKPVPQFQSSI